MINIDKLLGQILGAGQTMASGQSPLGRGSLGGSLGGALGSDRGKAMMGGLVLGGLAGALTGKTGKKIASTALKLGGAAAVAGLAYTAYQRYQTQQRAPRLPSQPQPQPIGYGAQAPSTSLSQRAEEVVDILPPANSGYLPPPTETAATEELSLKLIRAMIAAAKADGRIDAAESAKIFGQMDAMNFDDEERNFLMAELGKTWTAEQVAAGATSMETAVELYAASVIAVDPNRPAERDYLGRLAQRLNLEPGLVSEIHARCAA